MIQLLDINNIEIYTYRTKCIIIIIFAVVKSMHTAYAKIIECTKPNMKYYICLHCTLAHCHVLTRPTKSPSFVINN